MTNPQFNPRVDIISDAGSLLGATDFVVNQGLTVTGPIREITKYLSSSAVLTDGGNYVVESAFTSKTITLPDPTTLAVGTRIRVESDGSFNYLEGSPQTVTVSGSLLIVDTGKTVSSFALTSGNVIELIVTPKFETFTGTFINIWSATHVAPTIGVFGLVGITQTGLLYVGSNTIVGSDPVALAYNTDIGDIRFGSSGSGYLFDVQGVTQPDGATTGINFLANFGSGGPEGNRITLGNGYGTATWRVLGLNETGLSSTLLSPSTSVPNGTTYGDVLFTRTAAGKSIHVPSDNSWANPVATITGMSFGIGTPNPIAQLHATGSTIVGVANVPISSSNVGNSQVNIWVNEGSNQLSFQVKYSNGTIKNGTVSLS